jgi:hypothetical protein
LLLHASIDRCGFLRLVGCLIRPSV